MELVDGAADRTPLPFRPVPMLDDGVEEPSATDKNAGEMRRQLVRTDPEGRRAHAARIAKGGGTLCLSHGPWLRLWSCTLFHVRVRCASLLRAGYRCSVADFTDGSAAGIAAKVTVLPHL